MACEDGTNLAKRIPTRHLRRRVGRAVGILLGRLLAGGRRGRLRRLGARSGGGRRCGGGGGGGRPRGGGGRGARRGRTDGVAVRRRGGRGRLGRDRAAVLVVLDERPVAGRAPVLALVE